MPTASVRSDSRPTPCTSLGGERDQRRNGPQHPRHPVGLCPPPESVTRIRRAAGDRDQGAEDGEPRVDHRGTAALSGSTGSYSSGRRSSMTWFRSLVRLWRASPRRQRAVTVTERSWQTGPARGKPSGPTMTVPLTQSDAALSAGAIAGRDEHPVDRRVRLNPCDLGGAFARPGAAPAASSSARTAGRRRREPPGAPTPGTRRRSRSSCPIARRRYRRRAGASRPGSNTSCSRSQRCALR